MPAFQMESHKRRKREKKLDLQNGSGKALGLSWEQCDFCCSCVTIPVFFKFKIDFIHIEVKYRVDFQDFHVGIWNLKNLFSSSFCQASKEEELGDASCIFVGKKPQE